MADRRLIAAASAFILALVLAGGALVALALRSPAPPSPVVVTLPPPPPDEASPDTTEPEAAPAPAPTGEPEVALSLPEAAERAPPQAATAASPSPPRRLVVVATGIAWNDELAAAAAFRLPAAVTLALPADLPAAEERLARWRALGRTVVVRVDWRPTTQSDGGAVPLEAGTGVQAGRMEAQWAGLEDAAGAVVVEPHAAEALAPVARSLAASREAPVLLGARGPAPPPQAWQLDAGRLGERALDDALDRVVEGTAAGDTMVLLIEVYPALLDRLATWLRDLDDRGIALVPLDRLDHDRA
ncbi:MAG: hypothetical protein ACLFTG_16215 [Alphaproteobacteria bacterium]